MGALSPVVPEHAWGKVSYGLLFVAGLPVGAVLWARATEDVVLLPAVRAPFLGNGLVMLGAAMIAVAMRALWVRGGGLPMNPFPPPRRVEDGIYGLVRHPIYLGATALGLGLSLREGSASGLWLVTPALTLAWLALVWGYEARDLRRRFGPPYPVKLALPADVPSSALAGERTTALLVLIGPVVLAVRMLAVLDRGPPLGVSWSEPWATLARASPVVVVAVAIVFTRSAAALRRLTLRCVLALGLALAVCVAIPGDSLGRGDWVASALVAWAWMIPGWPARVCAVAVSVAWGPALAGCGLLLALISRPEWLWGGIRHAGERVANSLRLWMVGPVRVLSGAGLTFVSGFCMLAAASVLAGPHATLALGVGAVVSVVCSALWAQAVEGGHALSRPFGFYGSVLGLLIGAALAPLWGSSPALIVAAYAASGPIFMVVGRLRCLQQGCCHGAPAAPEIGIRYRHPISRVTTRTPWRDVPLHPTPVYSSLFHAVIGALVIRLWIEGSALGVLTGVTFILSGLARFVEESYRGEPQTPVYLGLRLYQYLALASIAGGIAFTILGSRRPAPIPEASAGGVVMAVLVGLFIAFATGVDFPRSSRRFARLV
jgi:protein-S-isoprenylcysteine O-methyltransferase Ste14